MIKSKITKSAKVEKTEKLPPVSPPASQKRTSDFPDFPLKNVQICVSERKSAWSPNHITFERAQTRSNADRLGAETTSRSNAQGHASERESA